MPPELVWYPLALGEQVARGQRATGDIPETAVRLGLNAVALPDALLAPRGGAHSAPAVRQVLDAAGNIVGTVADILDDVTDTLAGLDTGDLLKGDLLAVDVNVDLDAGLGERLVAPEDLRAQLHDAVDAHATADATDAAHDARAQLCGWTISSPCSRAFARR